MSAGRPVILYTASSRGHQPVVPGQLQEAGKVPKLRGWGVGPGDGPVIGEAVSIAASAMRMSPHDVQHVVLVDAEVVQATEPSQADSMHHCVHRDSPSSSASSRHGPALPLRVVAVGAGNHHMGRATWSSISATVWSLQPLVGGLDPSHQGGHAAVVGPLGQQGGHGGGGGGSVRGTGLEMVSPLPGRLDLVQQLLGAPLGLAHQLQVRDLQVHPGRRVMSIISSTAWKMRGPSLRMWTVSRASYFFSTFGQLTSSSLLQKALGWINPRGTYRRRPPSAPLQLQVLQLLHLLRFRVPVHKAHHRPRRVPVTTSWP